MVRTPCCDKSGLKKGTWTAEEDRKLTAYVSRYGCWNWRQLPRFAGLQRCGKSCRLRWMNYLRPNIKRGNYTKEEEETIIRLHRSLGNRWSAIAAQLPGRTDNEVKNHWHTNLKKRVQHNYVTHGLEKRSNNSSNDSNIPSQEKNKNNIVSEHNNNALEDQAALRILESSTLSPGQTYCSSDEVSTISTDTTFTETGTTNFAADDSNVSAYNSLETFSEFIGNFWTEPFLADNSYIPSEFLTPITDLEIFSPVFDGSSLSSTQEYYMEPEVLF